MEQNMSTTIESVRPPTAPAKAEPTLADMDLESMSRSEFAQALVNHMVATVKDQIVAPMSEQVGTLKSTTDMQNLRNEFNDVASKHKDFGLYKDIMLGMVDTHSHLTVEEMYKLAKVDHPEIATAAAEQTNNLSPAQKQGDTFGGLTPTSGSTIQNDGKADPTKAAEDAWNETMSAQTVLEA